MQGYANANNASRDVSSASEGRQWVVLLTHDTRRMMSTPEVHAELQAGTLRREVLVWRAGMSEWVPIAHIAELSIAELSIARPNMPAAYDGYEHAMPAGRQAQEPAHPVRPAPVHARRRTATPDPALVMELVTTGAVALIVVAVTSDLLSLGGAFAAGGGAAPHSPPGAAAH